MMLHASVGRRLEPRSSTPRRVRVTYVLSHPIQYFAPLLRKLAAVPQLDLKAIYATDAGATPYHDPGFGQVVRWDRPLLDGYDYRVLSPGKPLGSGFSTVSGKGLGRYLKPTETDLLIVHGWATHLSLTALFESWRHRIPVLLRGESQRHVKGSRWTRMVKPLLLFPALRRLGGFLAIGSLNQEYYLRAGVRPERIFWAPYSIDTEAFQEQTFDDEEVAAKAAQIGLRPKSFRALACGKLTDVKRPYDLIEAIARMPSKDQVEAIFIGDGPLADRLRRLAVDRGVTVHFLGFRNQTELPLLYALGDVLVLPSSHEPWGLVVNEAMTMGCPAIVSEVVGCGPDLVVPDESGYIVPVGEPQKIAEALERMVTSPDLRSNLEAGAANRVARFSMDRTVEGYLNAIESLAGPGVSEDVDD